MFITRPRARIAFAALIALAVGLLLMAGLSLASNDGQTDPAPLSRSELPSPVSSVGEGSVQMPRAGISGAIAAPPEVVDLNADGVEEVLFGTTSGFFIVGKGGIEQHIGPLAPVSEFTTITDISNDKESK